MQAQTPFDAMISYCWTDQDGAPEVADHQPAPAGSSPAAGGEPVKIGTAFPYIPMRLGSPQWIDRSDLWEIIDEHLRASRTAVLHGYAHRASRDGVTVSWIGSKNEEELQKNLDRFLAAAFNLKLVETDLDVLLFQFGPLLRGEEMPRLFVLENVNNVLDIEKFLAAVVDIPSDPLVLLNHVQAMQSIPVNFPSIASCRAYFLDIPGRTLSEAEANQIFHLCNGLPLRLSVASAFLGQRSDASVEAFVELVGEGQAELGQGRLHISIGVLQHAEGKVIRGV
ncbi:hypothetical protein DFJ73DRAFT_762734 [Zopfochytrium polystomum]|nr:hypothetical protein DFJ73DRAFT_762734 [Zopfochytrium polystomum]